MGIVHFVVAAATSSSDPKVYHIADLVLLGFYFYPRCCEYTKCTGHRRTVQFLPLLEFVFFVGGIILPMEAPIDHFHQATRIFLTLDN